MALPNGHVWDACSIINLMATGYAEDILQSLDSPSYIVHQVHEGEALFLRPLPEDPDPGRLIPIDFEGLIRSGLLHQVELEDLELETFVEFAAEVDDGEARTAAVAVHRGLCVMTDDRPAIRLMNSLPATVKVFTTPEWVKYWSESGAISDAVLAEVLRRIRYCARYHPRAVHPLRQWWDENFPED